MDFSATIDIIIKDLREIGEIVEDFKNYPGVSSIQVDIVRSKCRYAEEVMQHLKSAAITAPQPATRGEGQAKQKEKNDKPSGIGKEEDIAAVIKSIPLADITGAIRMNERFLFIREIFGGNAAAYDEAISKLNRAESLSDAKAIIMSYTGESKETEAVVQLLEIVGRKFPSDV